MISRLPCCVAQNSIRVKSSWVPRDQRSVLYATTASYMAIFPGSVTHGLRFLRSHGATVPDLVSATTWMTVIPSRSQNARDFSSWVSIPMPCRSEEHTSELQSLRHLVCRLLLEK